MAARATKVARARASRTRTRIEARASIVAVARAVDEAKVDEAKDIDARVRASVAKDITVMNMMMMIMTKIGRAQAAAGLR